VESIAPLLIFAILTAGVLIAITRALASRGPKGSAGPDNTLDLIPPSKPREPEETPWFRIPLAVLLVLGFYMILVPDSRAAAPALQKSQRVILDLADCPAQGENGLPLLIFIISTSADGGPVKSTCARIQKRHYQPAPRKSARPASIHKEKP